MEKDRLQNLFKKKLSGQCSIQEIEELARLIETLTDEELKSLLYTQWNSFTTSVVAQEESSRRIIESILRDPDKYKIVHTRRRKRKVLLFRLASIAASLILLVMAGKFTYQFLWPAPIHPVVITAEPVPVNQSVNYNRQVVLADGSIVVLKAGSTLECPPQFNASTREVILNGEAYFDIARDTSKPFTIRTGTIKVVVLGTAFTIKAWNFEKRVMVSVSRGKVKVEDDKKTLAILTANQQMQYDKKNSNLEQTHVVAEELVPDWTQDDLVFDCESLESIAHTLSKRFGVNISISDNELAGTLIVSSFSGVESLENILEILCKINGDVHYTINGKEILLTRESQQNKTKN